MNPSAFALVTLLTITAAGAQAEETQPEWNVTDTTSAVTSTTIDTREGTWMNIDVSPDGEHLLFDLLGDLYELPIDGGEARAVTTGHGWDFQPRYTTDGTAVIYTSDQGGGDNIWRIERDGTAPKQLTSESVRLLTSPAVEPNGGYFVARKHFTGPRSLGAGEIWRYDLDGGDGRPLTHRKNQQKDLGEPALSPDGKTLYYSYDATDGDIFEYGKDANKGIYAIDSLDLNSGRITRVAGGAGGAIRPTPSPDGKHLAFIRRVRGVSILVIKHLRSGAERTIASGLERDLQETWAVHGVYPTIDYTPDSKAIVYWAKGKLWRVSIETGQVREIPFHLKTEIAIEPAIRFSVDVAPNQRPVKMLRDVTHAPDGSSVLFTALGHLYIQRTADAHPKRLTRDDDVIEFDGAFSRDGKEIVYATWSDSTLGEIRTLKVGSKRPRVVATGPGHFIQPQFSPNSADIVYKKITGGGLLPSIWSANPGIYQVNRLTNERRLVRRSGTHPHYGSRNDRLFFSTTHEGKLALASQNLTTTDPEHTGTRVHVFGEKATGLRVSPNGKLVAIQEGYKVHVTRLPVATEPRDVGVGVKTSPHLTLSTHSGYNLHFSGDSRSLHWSLGATLYRADIDFNAEEQVVTNTQIQLANPKPVHDKVGAVQHVRILPMAGEPIEDGTVVWRGDRIIAVGPADEVIIPDSATIFDGTGRTLMPGLVDVHAHGSYGHNGIIPQQSWRALSYLAFGVTTIHDPSNDNETIFAAAERQRAGILLAPRIFSTGKILYGADAVGTTATVNSEEDAYFHINRQASIGAISVKSYNQPRREQRQMVLAAARELEIMVVPEGGALYNHNMTQVVDGHTGVEHAIPLANLYDDVQQLWGATDVGYTPTLGVAYGGLEGEQFWYAHTNVWEDKRLTQFVPSWLLDGRARRPAHAPLSEYNHIAVAAAAKGLTDAGVVVNIGGHGQREGLAPHWEIWMLEQGGYSPLEALHAATANGASYLGLDDIGTIEVGKLADFIVIDGDPTEDIRLTKEVKWTILGGVLLDAATMHAVFPYTQAPLPNAWERGHDGYPTTSNADATCGGIHEH